MIFVTASKPPSADDIARMVATSATATVRSPVYVWLRRNHAVLSAEFADARVNWSQVAAKLAEIGVTDAKGQKPRAEAVRRAWWQVRRDLAAAKAKRQAGKAPEQVPVSALGEVAPGVRLLDADARVPVPTPDEPGPSETVAPVKQRLALKPAKPRLPPTEGT